MIFDAELSANRAESAEAPSVSFLSLHPGSLVKIGQERTIDLDAVHPEGKVRNVSLFADDQQIGTLGAPPYVFKWTPRAGTQRLRAVAVDDKQRTAAEEIAVVGVQNIPPTVRMSVRQGREAGTLILAAEANDQDGQIRDAEFFMAENDRFDAPWVSVGRISAPPYEVSIRDPKSEHRGVSVQVTDDGGEIGVASTHIHSHR